MVPTLIKDWCCRCGDYTDHVMGRGTSGYPEIACRVCERVSDFRPGDR